MILSLYACIVLAYAAGVLNLHWLIYFIPVFYVIAEVRYSDLKERIKKLEKKEKGV